MEFQRKINEIKPGTKIFLMTLLESTVGHAKTAIGQIL